MSAPRDNKWSRQVYTGWSPRWGPKGSAARDEPGRRSFRLYDTALKPVMEAPWVLKPRAWPAAIAQRATVAAPLAVAHRLSVVSSPAPVRL